MLLNSALWSMNAYWTKMDISEVQDGPSATLTMPFIMFYEKTQPKPKHQQQLCLKKALWPQIYFPNRSLIKTFGPTCKLKTRFDPQLGKQCECLYKPAVHLDKLIRIIFLLRTPTLKGFAKIRKWDACTNNNGIFIVDKTLQKVC